MSYPLQCTGTRASDRVGNSTGTAARYVDRPAVGSRPPARQAIGRKRICEKIRLPRPGIGRGFKVR